MTTSSPILIDDIDGKVRTTMITASISPQCCRTFLRRCVYCLHNQEIKEHQILLRGEHLYLCAPKGQLIEGYLVISPYSCIGCLSQLPTTWFSELAELQAVVSAFYRHAYDATHLTIYEQGRAGGGALSGGDFPLHAHLCLLPEAVDLHARLAVEYVPIALPGAEGLPHATKNRPYIYVEAVDISGKFRKAVYVARSSDGEAALEQMRLKSVVASALNMPERGDWRAYPGDVELNRVIEQFAIFRKVYER